MDMSHLSFLRRFRGTRKGIGGGGSFELPGFGVAQFLSVPAAFPGYPCSSTLTASAGGRKRYPDNSASSPWSGPSATEAVRAGNGRRGQSCEHDGSAVS